MANGVLQIASRLAARTGVSKSLDRWNGRRGGIILAYHDISFERLAAQLALIAESYTFVSLTEFVNRIAQDKPTTKLAVITFDDGYGETMEAAARLAAANKWAMTFYLPTRYLDTNEPFWYQELKHLVGRSPHREVEIDNMQISLHDGESKAKAVKTLDSRFRLFSSAEDVEKMLREVRRTLLDSPDRPPDLPFAAPASWNRVRELATRDELSFEAHTVNHLAASRLSETQLRAELEQSRTRIEAATGKRVEHFCYPFGGAAEIGARAPEIVRSVFRSAVTMMRGRCHPGVDTTMLPRIDLYEGDTKEVVALKIGLAK
ncbi:MAG: polysaccharide deacetylase family protein [Pyrinomonadaceae bacterium MAG19_C2-C3]|nr:polysaccharide deacetylase family protein [Pyrinomonadaceae bacterium MAG19_C2-C3]